MNLLHLNVKKLCFKIHFINIISKVQPKCQPTPFRLVLLLFQTTRRREKPQCPVVCSPLQRLLGFLSVSVSKPYRVWGWWVLIWVQSLVLSKQTNDAACAITPSKYGGGKFRPHESEVKTEQTPVFDCPPGPRLNYS
jgi:hypothetical protein